MIRAVFKTDVWYSPNGDDMKKCAECQCGWAFTFSEPLGVYVHRPNSKTPAIVCRAVNDLGKVPQHYGRMLAKEAA